MPRAKGISGGAPSRLGGLIERFVNAVSHPRGRALAFLSEAAVTVDQAILLHHAASPGSTATTLAAQMNLSLPSMSQMIERLVKLGYLERLADPADRRRKIIVVTSQGKVLLAEFREIRSAEYAFGTARLRPSTKRILAEALTRVLTELNDVDSDDRRDPRT